MNISDIRALLNETPIEALMADRENFLTLCGLSPEVFGRAFFPRTFKHPSPPFHYQIWQELVSPHRHSAIMAFRGSGKTTLTRVFTAYRIALGISKTIIFTSASESHAIYSIDWIKRQIEHNGIFSQYFGLAKGQKWTENEIEISHNILGHTIRLKAVGITGQVRGINVGDARPDLIVADDPQDDETAATPEQRQKLETRFFGALEKSLVPATEVPEAKIVLLQTPLHREDLISRCVADPTWHSFVFGCFDEKGNSRWPERFPTEDLIRQREAHIARNQLSVWLREMECKLVDEESAAFKQDWLQYYDTLPDDLLTIVAIDPAISDSKDADFTAIVAIGLNKRGYFLIDYQLERGMRPDAQVEAIFSFVLRYRPIQVVVETVAYQKALEHLIRSAMDRKRIYFSLVPHRDRRKKELRIIQTLTEAASTGRLFVSRRHKEFISQFLDYPAVSHDDLLDAAAIAIDAFPQAAYTIADSDDSSSSPLDDYDRLIREGLWRTAI